MTKDTAENKVWYVQWWGIIIAILILPLFGTWYIWTQAKWNKKSKIGVIVVISIFLLIALTAPESNDTQITEQDNQSSVPVVTTPYNDSQEIEEKQTAPVEEKVEVPEYEKITEEDVSYGDFNGEQGKQRRTYSYVLGKTASQEQIEKVFNIIINGEKEQYPDTELTLWFFSDKRLVGKVGYDVAMVIYDNAEDSTTVTFATETQKKMGDLYLTQ